VAAETEAAVDMEPALIAKAPEPVAQEPAGPAVYAEGSEPAPLADVFRADKIDWTPLLPLD